MDNEGARCFNFQYFGERSFEILQNARVDIFYTREDFEGFKTAYSIYLSYFFLLDGMFTTTVFSSRRSRFVNSAFPNMKLFAQKYSSTIHLDFHE